MASGLERWASEVAEQYAARIAKLLGIPVGSYEVRVAPADQMPEGYSGASGTVKDGRVIWLNEKFLSRRNKGLVVHELTHAFLDQAGADRKLVEVVPDWVRWKLGLDTESDGSQWWPSDEVLAFNERDVKEWVDRQQAKSGTSDAAAASRVGRVAPPPYGDGGPGGTGGGGDTGKPDTPLPSGYEWVQDPDGNWLAAPTGDKEDRVPDWKKTSFKEAKAQSAASYRELLTAWGIDPGPLFDLINQAWKEEWNKAIFLEELRSTAEYRERFPGIFEKDGTMKMNEAQYIATERQYTSLASRAGINLGPKRMAYLFRNDVTPEEFGDRAVALNRLKRNKELYTAFKRELVQGGIAKPADVNTQKEMFKFIMGAGDPKWYDLWQDTLTRNAAVQAGIVFGKNKSVYQTLGQKVIERISGMDLSEEQMAAQFIEASELLRTVLPTTEAGAFNVKKQDIVKATFGGKGAARARGKIQRAQEASEAFQEARAATALEETEEGRITIQKGRGFSGGSEY